MKYFKIKFQRAVDNSLGKIICMFLPSKKRLRPGKINKIILFKLSAIGDGILSLPMIKELKKQLNSEVVVVCSKENLDVFKNQKFLDKIILFNNTTKNPMYVVKKIREIIKEKADASIDTSQSAYLSAIISKLGSKYSVGFFNPRTEQRNKILDKGIPLNQKKHISLNYLDLAKNFVTGKDGKEFYLIPPHIEEGAKKKIEKLLKGKKNLVGVHATNLEDYRRWPEKKFSRMIEYLIKSLKYNVVLVGAPSEKGQSKDIISSVDKKLHKSIINLVGKTNVKELFALMPKLKFFIANDGGPMHIAASFNLPVIGLFGSDTPERYAPFNKKSYSIYKPKTNQKNKKEWERCTDPDCMENIALKDVKDTILLVDKSLNKKKTKKKNGRPKSIHKYSNI